MTKKQRDPFFKYLKEKALKIRRETLLIHKNAPETRLASSLSAVEIFTVLYYGKLLSFKTKDLAWANRDRLIISKGHGAISLYPVLCEFGLLTAKQLKEVCKEGSVLGGIPDPIVPGFETVNGSLGHGLGVACGIALALKRRNKKQEVFVLLGDGELYEGSVWEAVMFAAQHKLDNLILIVDNNKVCMLDFCKNVINLEPLEKKFAAFNWMAKRCDGHDAKKLYLALKDLKEKRNSRPKVLIADTVKGKGVPSLEADPLSHIRVLNGDEVDQVILEL